MHDDNSKDMDLANFDASGTPRWFSFILEGGPILGAEDSESYAYGSSRVADFSWPIPQVVRLATYARRFAREGDHY